MKALIYLIFLLAGQLCLAQQIPVIPLPNQYNIKEGTFLMNANTPIIAGGFPVQQVAHFLQKEILRYTSIPLSLQPESRAPAIILKLSDRKMNDDAYTLQMNSRSVVISASGNEGLFNGVSSLLQLIRKTPVKNASLTLTCWDVKDSPLYSWRGIMLDESRHFFGKEKVKSLLDWMAFYKLNRFHWHLSDQQGWRLEIRQYPKLALIGGIGNYSDKYAPARYYTQEDIKEIVSYAAERFITVIPEIDMPGHAQAANIAYPEFSGGGSEKYPEFTFNPGKTEVYNYLTNIIKEVDALFPSQMIHLGGDEVRYGNQNWSTNPDVISLMQNNKLQDLSSVENYFFRRMADSVIQLNNKILAWDEMADSDLPADKTILFWWRHDKPEQLKTAFRKGFSVVLCPRLPLYFDFVQDSTHQFGRRWQGSFNSLDKVYGFSEAGVPQAENKTKLVLGIQANLWTETVPTEQRLDYLIFPRICALAESAWTEMGKKDFQGFETRLKNDLELFRQQGVYYYDPVQPGRHSEPAPDER